MDIVEQGVEIVKEFQRRNAENASAVTNADRRYASTDYAAYGVELCPCEHTEGSSESPCCAKCRCSVNDVVKYHNEMVKRQNGTPASAVLAFSSSSPDKAEHGTSGGCSKAEAEPERSDEVSNNVKQKARDAAIDPALVQLMNRYIPPPKGEVCPICGGRRVYARLPARTALPIGAKRKEEYPCFQFS